MFLSDIVRLMSQDKESKDMIGLPVAVDYFLEE